ncbi:hypothetical protein [Nocardioides plantarum]|uniref:Uncharacterized protein n=1 Tax=Nocardioides plantarum TaxID=29299 RepID=A0ABV5KAK4_9ACTN|nr:hypothetical protein [Nocardioides plantarum]
MSDPQIRAYVDDLAERVPHVEPPLVGVLAAGRAAVVRRRRRRGMALVVGAAVAVAAVVVGHGLVVPDGPGDGRAAARVPESDRPEPPAGMKFVGANGIVIAVPDTWTQVEADECDPFLPDRTYVLQGRAGTGDGPVDYEALAEACNARRTEPARGSAEPTPRGSSPFPDESLTVSTGSSDMAFLIMGDGPDPTPVASTSNGLDLYSYVDCAQGQCQGLWSIGDDHVGFAAQVDPVGGKALLEAMGRSIRRLPAGWTTSEVDGTVVPS